MYVSRVDPSVLTLSLHRIDSSSFLGFAPFRSKVVQKMYHWMEFSIRVDFSILSGRAEEGLSVDIICYFVYYESIKREYGWVLYRILQSRVRIC